MADADRPVASHLPRPIRARLLGAQLGKNFSETISALIRFNDDVEAVTRHFAALDLKTAKKALKAEPESEPSPEFESPLLICKSESEPIVVVDNATAIAEMVARGVLVRAEIVTLRGARKRIYASPGFARFLNGPPQSSEETLSRLAISSLS